MEWKDADDPDQKIVKLRECRAGPLTINKYRRRDDGHEFFAATVSATACADTDDEGGRLVVAELLRKSEAAAEAVGYLDADTEAMRALGEDRDQLALRVVELENFIEGLRYHAESGNSVLRRIADAAEDVL